MIEFNTNYTTETYGVLRNCDVLGGGEMDGIAFVRCIPRALSYGQFDDAWEVPATERTAMVLRVVANVNDPGVVVSFNPDFGGDYVRVAKSSRVYRLICQMRS